MLFLCYIAALWPSIWVITKICTRTFIKQFHFRMQIIHINHCKKQNKKVIKWPLILIIRFCIASWNAKLTEKFSRLVCDVVSLKFRCIVLTIHRNFRIPSLFPVWFKVSWICYGSRRRRIVRLPISFVDLFWWLHFVTYVLCICIIFKLLSWALLKLTSLYHADLLFLGFLFVCKLKVYPPTSILPTLFNSSYIYF